MWRKILTFFSAWWPSMIVVAVILYATWVPKPLDPDDIPPIPEIDKIIHAVMMGGFVGALLFDIRRHRRDIVLSLRLVLKVALAVAVFSAVEEFVQGILPIGRPSDPLDLVADWIGVIFGALLAPPAVNAVLPRK
ncbi:MAG: VanZ family protein [Muribaculaceae bacterium]|nr:VanZ family protein [Muribaculaceae bacterium]